MKRSGAPTRSKRQFRAETPRRGSIGGPYPGKTNDRVVGVGPGAIVYYDDSANSSRCSRIRSPSLWMIFPRWPGGIVRHGEPSANAARAAPTARLTS